MNPLEQQLRSAGQQPRSLATSEVEEPRLGENLLAIHAELDAPREPFLARNLRRIGVPDLTIPLVTATPALRRSWFVAVAIAVFFALSTASNQTAVGVDRIGVFLTLAPLVPLAGVALAFGKGVDPTHDLVVAAPRDTFAVFLIRALTVLVASTAILLLASTLLPDGGLYRVAWLLPGMALTAATMALSSRFDARRSAIGLAAAWIALVLIVNGAASVQAMFGPVTQAVSVAAAITALMVVRSRRSDFETVPSQ